MSSQTTSQRYSTPSIAMHWAMVLLFVAVYALINVAEGFEKGSAERQMARDWHFTFGLLILALVWLRIALRVLGTTPPIQPAPSALMVVLPVVGWLVLSARGKPIPFFGLELPALIAPDKALGGQLKEFHELGGNVGYFLIGGHAIAALLHHYVLKDNTLRRMVFGRQT